MITTYPINKYELHNTNKIARERREKVKTMRTEKNEDEPKICFQY